MSSSCDNFAGPTATPRQANGACVGEPREASLSQICRKPRPKSLRLAKPAPNPRGGIVKNPGPLSRQGGHLCPPWLWGRPLPKTPSFGEQYSRHLVDVKWITLHIVFYAFPARTKRVTLFGPPRFSIFRGWTRRRSTLPPLPRTVWQHAFRHPFFRVEASSSQRISASFSP